MKITRLEIKEYQQFKDFTLTLTYPQGHPKAGQPLEKVCFIGQSGTGKTTILNVISDLINNEEGVNTFFDSQTNEKTLLKIDFQTTEESGKQTQGWQSFENGELIASIPSVKTLEDVANSIAKVTNDYLDVKKRVRGIFLETGLEKQIQLLQEEREINTGALLANNKEA